MKSIQDELNFYQDIVSSKKESLDQLCQDEAIQAFMKQNNLDRQMMDDYWIELLNYQEDYQLCVGCRSLDSCPKKLPGYKRKLHYEDRTVSLMMEACDYQSDYEQKQEILMNITSNIPITLFKDDFKDIAEIERGLFVRFASFLTGDKSRGIYLYGQTQTRKTRMMASFSYKLAKEGKKVAFINVPSFMSELKAQLSSSDNQTNQWINLLKNVEILIFDDIGGENFSAWSRDEIIGNIIQERVLSNLPTFYTSVYDLDSLAEYYTTRQKGEQVKVLKLIEKIRSSCDLYRIHR